MKFTQTHEWIRLDNGVGVIGISSYAKKELGELVYVEFKEVGKKIKAGEEIAVLESTKAAADVYSPVSGTIVEVNEGLKKDLTPLNDFPEKEGWLIKIKVENRQEFDQLMEMDAYQKMLK